MKMPILKYRPIAKQYGGKYYLASWIISHFPANYESLKYVETCGGVGASVLLNKDKSETEIYNDINPASANIFHCIKNYPDTIINIINNIDYCEKSFEEAEKIELVYGKPESAVAELVLRRMSRTGMKKNFSWSKRLRGKRPENENAWETFKTVALPCIVERLRQIEVYNKDLLDVISEHDSEKTLFYIDPPYVHSTRVSKDVYEYEMTNEQHEQIGEMLNSIEGKAIISGYDCLLYQKLYKNWRCVAKAVKNNAGQTKVKSNRIECLWLNY